jgi:predicted deacetylase
MQKQPARLLLIGLHDVTPAHAGRLQRAERLLAAHGVDAAAYLFVPDYHGRAPACADGAFAAWCRAPRPYAIEWFLHGFRHREDEAAARGTWRDRLARRFLTDGEGEFLGLRGRALDDRLRAGLDAFARVLPAPPSGFIAPAWLYNDDLLPALARHGLRFTESHFHVFDVRAGRAWRAPVMTWATRSAGHRAGAAAVAAVERRLWRRAPVVRLALHPCDFDHPRIVDSVVRALDVLRRGRRIVSYAEACGAG